MPLGGIRIENEKEFVREIKAFGDVEVPKRLQKVTQKASAFALRRVVKRTPVGDPSIWAPQSLPPPKGYRPGRARGGWQVGINRTTETDINRIDPSGATAIATGIAVIATAQPFDEVIIYNNVPYILPLENGSSTQAPNGMVRLTILEIAAQRFD